MKSEIKIFPPQDFTAFCGCKVRFDNDGFVRWELCKLHNSTPQLLAERDALREACRFAEEAFRVPAGTSPNKEIAALAKLRAALALSPESQPVSQAKTIEVCERTMDRWIDDKGKEHPTFHAQLAGNPGMWAQGRSADAAVGDLVRSHPEAFGVEIKLLGKLPR